MSEATASDVKVDPRKLTPGSSIRWRDTTDVRVLDRRKDDDTGWWLVDGSGLADHAWDGGWSLVEKMGVARTRVYKYPLILGQGEQVIDMPAAAKIVHVHEQDERPCLWAEINTTAPITERTFMVFATGEDVRIGGLYVGTIHVGWTVWHIYEYTQRRAFLAGRHG